MANGLTHRRRRRVAFACAGELGRYNDVLDDVREMVGERRVAWAARVANSIQLPAVSRWLNPRVHRWRTAALVALAAGIVLALVEVFGEGLPQISSRAALVVAVFVGIEGAGVLLGYVLFVRFLGLLRSKP